MRPQVCSVLVWSVSRSLHHILCHSWQHTGVVHLSLQADGKVAFEDIPVFGVCRPACHDSSLYLFVLVLFLEAVVLSQVLYNTNFSRGGNFRYIREFGFCAKFFSRENNIPCKWNFAKFSSREIFLPRNFPPREN